MNKLLIRIELFKKLTIIKIRNLFKLLKFMWFIHSNHIFRDGDPKLVLKVIQKFIEIEHKNYSRCIVLGRTVQESSVLLSNLISVYLKDNSDIILNQITKVLRDEFIKREDMRGFKF